jgi:hypothetical protein
MVYSFLNVNCSLVGLPAFNLNLAAGAAVAEEGITIEAVEDKNVMTIGADGKGQHSLVANDARKVTIRLLKTSPTNQALQLMYDAQSASSALWGQNVMTITDSGRGDVVILQAVAFKKQPTITYAKEAGLMEWEFDAISGTAYLGAGQ